MARATQPGQSIWKAQATMTRPRCSARRIGAELFTHSDMYPSGANPCWSVALLNLGAG
jgi:hypothetical protein